MCTIITTTNSSSNVVSDTILTRHASLEYDVGSETACSSVSTIPKAISNTKAIDTRINLAAIQGQILQLCCMINIDDLKDPGRMLWEVLSDYLIHEDPNAQSWWRTTGFLLATLFQKAGYTVRSQCEHLVFYHFYVTPELGPVPNASRRLSQWKSFMTDSFTPIEMSWEWGLGIEAPVVRFSIEPIGFDAGTPIDPLNEHTTNRLVEYFRLMSPNTDLRWYRHFSNKLLAYNRCSPDAEKVQEMEGHKSRSFVAFDFGKRGIMLKAYYIPTFKAQAINQSNLAVISQAIADLPHCQASRFPAYDFLLKYIQSSDEGSQLKAEIFSIDCVIPEKSRFKIYLRTQSTSFNSIRAIMTFDGVLAESNLDKGLEELEKLWKLVLEPAQHLSPADELYHRAHRTAGNLYYFEFRPGQLIPVPKLYIPVRHYGQDDHAIAEGLKTYLQSRGQDLLACKYVEALQSI